MTASADNQALSANGIVTDLAKLLGARHWAQGLNLFSRQAARNLLLGNVRSRYRGRGMEFEEVRRYQAGDDIRTIDWKVSARASGTYTKLFCEERERPCHILVDQRSSLFFGSNRQFKSVLSAELASGIAWAALKAGDRVGGQVIGDYDERDVRARRSKQSVLSLIHSIHEFNNDLSGVSNHESNREKNSLANSLEECRRITRPGTAIYVLSDFHDFDHEAAKALSNLGKHADLTLMQVYDTLEQELPNLGAVRLSDGQQSAKLNLSKSITEAYQEQSNAKQTLLISSATKARAYYASINTSQSAKQSLIRLFAK